MQFCSCTRPGEHARQLRPLGKRAPRITVFRVLDVSLSAEPVGFSTRRQAELLDDRANDGDSSYFGFYAAGV